MRRSIWIAAAALVALVAAGVAVAHNSTSKGIKVVTTSFTAAPTSDTRTRSCTDATGAVWQITNGTWQGTATGDIAGSVTIRSQSIVNTQTGSGFMQGKLIVRDAGSRAELAEANLDAVNAKGALQGLLRGHTRDGMLLATFSAALGSSSLNGTVGSGTGTNSAIVFGGLPKCSQTSVTPPKPILRTEGTVTTASATSLTISAHKASYTISVPSSLSAQAGALKTGDRVEITAAQVNGAYVLVTLKSHH